MALGVDLQQLLVHVNCDKMTSKQMVALLQTKDLLVGILTILETPMPPLGSMDCTWVLVIQRTDDAY